jgi:uncharacterized FAD-dependent dehydrogenase
VQVGFQLFFLDKSGAVHPLQHFVAMMPEHGPYRILRQSVDARRKHSPHFVYSVEVAEKGETLVNPEFSLEKISNPKEKPLIVGTGPAGLFAALRFVERGVPCVLFERGSDSGERMKGINQYWSFSSRS